MSQERMAAIVRTVVLFVALLNQLLLVFDCSILPLSEELVEELASTVLTVSASLWVWWKEQHF